MDLKATAEILFRKKWLIAFSVVLTVLLTAGATRLTGAKWTGTVKFLSPIASPLAESPQEHNGGAVLDPRAQSTMYASIVKSIDVVRPALEHLSFANSATDILDRIDFDASGDRMYELKVSDTNPRRAEMLANAVADSFVKRNQELSTQQARNIVHLLEDQLKQADANIVRVRARYDTYSAQHRVVGDPSSQLYLVLKRLETARMGRSEEQSHLAQLRAHRKARGEALAHLPADVGREIHAEPSALVKSLDAELAQIELSLLDLRQQYTDSNPKVAALLEKRAKLQARRKEELSSDSVLRVPNPAKATLADTLDEMDREIASSQATLEAEDSSIVAAEAEMKKLRDVNSPLNTMGAELASATEARTNLAARLNSARLGLDSVSQQHSLVIVEHVGVTNPPVNMTAGRSKKLVMLAGLCALIASCALVMGLDSLDRRVKTVAQIERQLPVRVLAAIPRPVNEVPSGSLARATEMLPLSPHAEAYRFLGQSILQAGGDVRSMMVVAAKSGQGNTNTIVNLGITLAQSGKRVLLVDANVRNPRLHTIFGFSNKVGLTDVLQSPTLPAVKNAVQDTPVPNLRVLPSGPASRNPWTLFSSQRLCELATHLLAQADIILYDTPSAVAFTDAMNLASVVDGALLCVRTLEVLNGEEARLLEQIQQAGVTVLGCVMTDVPAAVMENFRDYQHTDVSRQTLFALENKGALSGGTSNISREVLSESEDGEFVATGNEVSLYDPFEQHRPVNFVSHSADTNSTDSYSVPINSSAPNFVKEYSQGAGDAPDAQAVSVQEDDFYDLPVLIDSKKQESTLMAPQSDPNNSPRNSGSDSATEATNLPPAPVFTRAFNGYTVQAVDAYVQRIMSIIADLQKHIDQQSLRVQDLSGQLTQQRSHTQQLESQLAQSQGYAGRINELTEQLAASTMRANEFAAELKAARQQMDEMIEREAAGIAALKLASQMRSQLEQEQAQAHTELAQARETAQAEADAILEAAKQQANMIEASAQSQRQEYQAQLEEIRAQSRAQMTQMLTILKNEAGTLFAETRNAAATEAEQKYHRLQQQLEQEQAQAQAEMARAKEAAQAEADAILEAARQQAHTITDETERNRHDAAHRLAELYAAQEERLKTLGTECNAAITNIRQMLEAQLALTALPCLPSAPLTVKSSPEVERIDEGEKRDVNGNFRAMWQ